MSDDDKSLIKDTMRTLGWSLIDKKNKEIVQGYRSIATAKGTSREEREWYSALALGREELFMELEQELQ